MRNFTELGINHCNQVFFNELLYHVPLFIHDTVDAKVKICGFELEQFSEQGLEFLRIIFGHQIASFSIMCLNSLAAILALK